MDLIRKVRGAYVGPVSEPNATIRAQLLQLGQIGVRYGGNEPHMKDDLILIESLLFQEVGRKISKTREEKIRAALEAIQSVLSELDDDDENEANKAESFKEAVTQATEALSNSDQWGRLSTAVAAAFPDDITSVADVFNDTGIVAFSHMPRKKSQYDEYEYPDYSQRKLYRLNWEEFDNQVTLSGTPVEVVHRSVYDDVKSSASIDATEAD